ncbi:hypothetical protein [Lysinibacillus sp. NPDC056185]|uniref:hypothetical protein n=1 Tax=Lysinibacillus sp. NPDC056185 TaxID=3345739 RepID=UPI0039F05204
MSQNIQKTGIFDLNDITGGIQLPNFKGAFQQDDTELIAPPKFLVDVRRRASKSLMHCSFLKLSPSISFANNPILGLCANID